MGNAKWLKRRCGEPLHPAPGPRAVVKMHSHSRVDQLQWPGARGGGAGRGSTGGPPCRSLGPLKQVAVSPDCLAEPSLLNGRQEHNRPSLRGLTVHRLPLQPPQALPAQPSPLIDPTFRGLTVSSQGGRNGFETHGLFQVVKQNLVVRSNTLPRAWGKAETQQQGELGGGNQRPREWGVQPLPGPGNRQPLSPAGDGVMLGWRHLFCPSFYQRRTIHVLDSVFKSVLQVALWLELIPLMLYSEQK